MLPADVVLFAAHEPEPERPAGTCYIETKSLDGETNLKGRAAPQALALACGGTLAEQTKSLSRLAGRVECEQPNAATSKFVGTLRLLSGGVSKGKGPSASQPSRQRVDPLVDDRTTKGGTPVRDALRDAPMTRAQVRKSLAASKHSGGATRSSSNGSGASHGNGSVGAEKSVGADNTEMMVLSINNVLLRGSSVRNTEYIIGLVVNTGVDTKVMQGARAPPLKRSQIDLAINVIMWTILGVQARRPFFPAHRARFFDRLARR